MGGIPAIGRDVRDAVAAVRSEAEGRKALTWLHELASNDGSIIGAVRPGVLETEISDLPSTRMALRYHDLVDAVLELERLPSGGSAVERCQAQRQAAAAGNADGEAKKDTTAEHRDRPPGGNASSEGHDSILRNWACR